MKIGRKILLCMLLMSFCIAVLLSGLTSTQFSILKSNMIKTQNTEADLLYDKNIAIMNEANKQTASAFAASYANSIDLKFKKIENNIIILKNSLENLYALDQNVKSIFSDDLVYLQPNVKLQDVASEFEKIKSIRDIMESINKADKNVMTYYVSKSGMLLPNVYIDYYSNGNNEIDRRGRDWYLGAKNSKQIFWTPVYMDAALSKYAITCSAPIYSKSGEFLGVVGQDISIDDLCSSILTNEAKDIFSYSFLLSDSGVTIASSSADTALESLVDENNLKMLKQTRNYSGSEIFESNNALVGYAPLKSAGWKMLVFMNYNTITAPAANVGEAILASNENFIRHLSSAIFSILIIFLGISVLVLIISSVASRLLSHSIVKPLEILNSGVKVISAGNLNFELNNNSHDEIGELSVAINTMTARLKKYIDDLQAVTAEKERIGAELNVATKIQASMLPCIFPAFPEREEFDIFATMLPAKEVGGDFYDFFLIDNKHLGVVIADVSGKGVPAALFMVIAKTLIKNNSQYGKAPSQVFETVNNQLCENNEAGMFVTAFMGILEIDTGKFTYVNAGHNPPLIKRAGEDFKYLNTKPGFVLAGLDDMSFSQDEIMLKKGDILYLYTDGVTEAVNEENQLFSDEKLLADINTHKNESIKQLLHSLKAEIDDFAGKAEQFDDITMLALLIN